jgi:P27 family predicted phage terminase small subunit
MAGTAHSGGRNKRSAASHQLTGTLRRDRHTFTSPSPPTGEPVRPDTLKGEARAEWDRMVVRLTASQTLSTVDDAALYVYCRVFADAERLQRAVDALDSPFFDKVSVDGAGVEHIEPKVHPGFAQLRSYRQALRQFLVEFGLTPSSRSRVKLADTTERDELQEFFSRVN